MDKVEIKIDDALSNQINNSAVGFLKFRDKDQEGDVAGSGTLVLASSDVSSWRSLGYNFWGPILCVCCCIRQMKYPQFIAMEMPGPKPVAHPAPAE
jgi:hypothetical protein